MAREIQEAIKCFNCGEENHTLQSCTKEILKCKNCGLYGHVEQNCCSKKVEKGKSHVNHLNNDDTKEAKEWKYSLKARGLINKPNSSHYPLIYLDLIQLPLSSYPQDSKVTKKLRLFYH
jgi:transcription elongation factor Elf1